MGESPDEYTIIEDTVEQPVQITPRCSIVKVSCGFIPKAGAQKPAEEARPRGDPYTMGRLDATYRDAMAVLDTLFDINLSDPEQQDVAMRIRSEMAHYRLLIDSYSNDKDE